MFGFAPGFSPLPAPAISSPPFVPVRLTFPGSLFILPLILFFLRTIMPSDKQMPQYSEKYFDDTYEYRCVFVCLVSLFLGVVLGGSCWCLGFCGACHSSSFACRGLGNRPLREGGREGFLAIVRDVCACVCVRVRATYENDVSYTHSGWMGGWVCTHARRMRASVLWQEQVKRARFGSASGRLRLGSRISHTRVVFISAKRGQPRSYAYMFLAQPQQRITAAT